MSKYAAFLKWVERVREVEGRDPKSHEVYTWCEANMQATPPEIMAEVEAARAMVDGMYLKGHHFMPLLEAYRRARAFSEAAGVFKEDELTS